MENNWYGIIVGLSPLILKVKGFSVRCFCTGTSSHRGYGCSIVMTMGLEIGTWKELKTGDALKGPLLRFQVRKNWDIKKVTNGRGMLFTQSKEMGRLKRASADNEQKK